MSWWDSQLNKLEIGLIEETTFTAVMAAIQVSCSQHYYVITAIR